MLPSRDSRLVRFFLIGFFILAAIYALFEIRGQIIGPTITLEDTPALVRDAFIHIKGRALRMSSITLNGGEMNVTENGSFDQPYLLAPGYNRIVLDAKDAYGRTRERIVEIVYQPVPAASTTATTTMPASSSTAPVAPAQ